MLPPTIEKLVNYYASHIKDPDTSTQKNYIHSVDREPDIYPVIHFDNMIDNEGFTV